MKKNILFVLSLFFAINVIFAQNTEQRIPPSFQFQNNLVQQPQVYNAVLQENVSLLRAEDMESVKNGQPLRIAVGIAADLELIDRNLPSLRLTSGERIRRQAIKSEGANGLILTFGELYIPEGGILFVYTENREQVIVFTHTTNPAGGAFATTILYQDEIVLEYVESTVSSEQARINVSNIGYVYRSQAALRDVMTCYINVGCSEGDDWILQKNGVVGLLMSFPGSRARDWYICSGSLVNNVRQDGTPYILTANHCVEGYDAQTFTTMVFSFFKESVSANCTDQSGTSPLTKTMTGASLIADIPIKNASDGTLLKLTNSIPDDWEVYYNGWDARNVAATSGVSIHHPNGMVKKISTFTQPLKSVGNINMGAGVFTGANAHWEVRWSRTENGQSVTYGGSSGSPIFNQNGHIVGTLTGGSSYCQTPNSPDYYGKFSYHWNQYSDATQHFSQFLDPDNTGMLVLDGFDPNGFDFTDNPPIATNATNITATGFTANWDVLVGATRYFLDVYQFDADSTVVYLSGFQSRNVGNVTSFSISGLNPATEYFYVVRAGAGILSLSESSNEISVETDVTLDHFSVVATEATFVKVNSFQANWEMLPQATNYFLSVYQRVIGRDVPPDSITYVLGYENLDVGNVSSHTVEGLEHNTLYFYTVVASDGIYFSEVSNEIKVTTNKVGNSIDEIRTKSRIFVVDANIVIHSISSENLAVYNIAGQRLLSQTISAGETVLPKANFSSGVYFVRVGIETHKILIR